MRRFLFVPVLATMFVVAFSTLPPVSAAAFLKEYTADTYVSAYNPQSCRFTHIGDSWLGFFPNFYKYENLSANTQIAFWGVYDLHGNGGIAHWVLDVYHNGVWQTQTNAITSGNLAGNRTTSFLTETPHLTPTWSATVHIYGTIAPGRQTCTNT